MSLKDRIKKTKSDTVEKTLSVKNETVLSVDGHEVQFIEYEPSAEGNFVKVCTGNHELGVAAEYTWFHNKYNGAEFIEQEYTSMRLNGTVVKCDILTIQTAEGQKKIFFDISQMMADLNNKVMEQN